MGRSQMVREEDAIFWKFSQSRGLFTLWMRSLQTLISTQGRGSLHSCGQNVKCEGQPFSTALTFLITWKDGPLTCCTCPRARLCGSARWMRLENTQSLWQVVIPHHCTLLSESG